MSKDTLRSIIYMILLIGSSILIFRFIIWAFPIIIILVLGFIIYRTIKKESKEVKRSKKVSSETKKTKKMKVIHEFDDED